MKILSWNVNGLRSVYRKNFISWLKKIDTDVVCLQEIKTQMSLLPPDLAIFKNSFILREVKGSNHCPIGVELMN